MLQTLVTRPIGRVLNLSTLKQCPRGTHRSLSTSSPARSGILGVDRHDHRSLKRLAPRPTKIPRWKLLGEERRPRTKIYPPPQSTRSHCKDPIASLTASQIETLDPTGARSRLFAKQNREGAKVGDILLVRQRNGDPFAGVCLNIRRRGVDTAVLLRNQLTRIGAEMWYKIYSPNVDGIEVVQKRAKRARRARLYFMREPKHDLGSVDSIVRQYQRRRQALRSGSEARGRDANAHRRQHGKSK